MNSASISAIVLSMVAQRMASRRPSSIALEAAGLHDRGMQIEIMRHHGRADDADGDVEHLRIGHDLRRWHEAAEHGRDRRRRQHDLDQKAARDHDQQRDDEASRKRKPRFISISSRKAIERGDQRAADQRDAEQQLERDGRADNLGEIAGDDRQSRRPARARSRPAADRRRGTPARDRARWRCRAGPTAPAAGWPSGWTS